MACTLSGMEISRRLMQDWNAVGPMLVRPSGRLTLTSRLQPLNTASGSACTPVGTVISVRLLQPCRASLPNDSSPAGNVRSVSAVQPENALSPI